MKIKASKLMMIALCAVLTACGNSQYFKTSGSPYSLLNGRTAKKKYESLSSVGIGELNYMKTSAAQNAQHFANFVDGLLTHNDFGTLELNLAKSARQEQDFKEFIFEIRDDENLVWVTSEGKPYKYGGKVQKVTAEDFVTGAKLINTFAVGSDTGYLMRDFIKGAAEYYLYTEILDGIANGSAKFTKMDTNAKKAKFINDTLKSDFPAAYKAQYDPAYGGTPVTADDINNIENGSRLGVKVENGNSVRYSLLDSAMYFPTLLTYSTYLPVNQHFYDEKKAGFGTGKPDSILYCGPYILTESNETSIEYTKNKYYAKRKDVQENRYKQALVEKVHFTIKSDIESGDARIAFESGNIDGFSLSPNDKIGWDKYVIGPDASNPGKIEEPYSGLVNSRWLDTIGSCYGSNLVLDRTKNNKSKVSYYSKGNAASVANTERALRLQEVRQMLMSIIDYRTYYERYANGDMDDILAVQRLVSTYVPRKFVMDNNGNEYVESYYAQALSDYSGKTLAEAQEYIAPGQYETRQLDWSDVVEDYNGNEHTVGSERAQINALVNNAVAAINEYNESSLAAEFGTITFPVNIEYYSMWDADQESKTYDNEFINAMNRRLNNWEDSHQPKADYSDCTVFKMVPTDKVTKTNYENVSGSTGGEYAAYDFSVVQWGWGADYGDPLTYMNTYTYGGDWSSVFAYVGFAGDEATQNIRHNPDTNALEAVDLLGEYTGLVNEGKAETLNLTNRFQAFAEAEVKLIEELAIYKPQVNYGQGWSLSISNSAGYEMPTSNYGLSNDRMTGMYVLKDVLTAEERKAIRTEQEAAKEAWTSSHDAYNIYG